MAVAKNRDLMNTMQAWIVYWTQMCYISSMEMPQNVSKFRYSKWLRIKRKHAHIYLS